MLWETIKQGIAAIQFRSNKGMNNNFGTILANVLSDFGDISYVLDILANVYKKKKFKVSKSFRLVWENVFSNRS